MTASRQPPPGEGEEGREVGSRRRLLTGFQEPLAYPVQRARSALSHSEVRSPHRPAETHQVVELAGWLPDRHQHPRLVLHF